MRDFEEEMLRITRDLATIASKLEASIAEVDRVGRRVDELRRLRSTSSRAPVEVPSARSPYGVNGPRDVRTQALVREAEGGAHGLSVDWHADGSALVSVNNGKPFPLPPLLAALLAILAAQTGDNDGLLVCWKPKELVLTHLTERTGWKGQPRALNQLVHRLRRRLEKGGVNHRFLQWNARTGFRFALQVRAVDELKGTATKA